MKKLETLEDNIIILRGTLPLQNPLKLTPPLAPLRYSYSFVNETTPVVWPSRIHQAGIDAIKALRRKPENWKELLEQEKLSLLGEETNLLPFSLDPHNRAIATATLKWFLNITEDELA